MRNISLSFLSLAIIVTGMVGCTSKDGVIDSNSITATTLDNIVTGQAQNNTMAPGPVQELVTSLEGASGSTVGPGGALFVTEGALGKFYRVDPKTGEVNGIYLIDGLDSFTVIADIGAYNVTHPLPVSITSSKPEFCIPYKFIMVDSS